MSIINTTPHTINLHRPDGTVLAIEPDQRHQVRAIPVGTASQIGSLHDLPVFSDQNTKVVDLPPMDPKGVDCFLVSRVVFDHPSTQGRLDLIAPGTGPNDNPVRNDQKQIVGITRFIGRL